MFKVGEKIYCIDDRFKQELGDFVIVDRTDYRAEYPNNQMISLIGHHSMYNTLIFISLKEYRKLKLKKIIECSK